VYSLLTSHLFKSYHEWKCDLGLWLVTADQQVVQNDPGFKKLLNFLRSFAKGELQYMQEQTYKEL